VRDSWDQRIRRADELAADTGPAAPLLAFYGRVLRAQRLIYESFESSRPSGVFERDVSQICHAAPALLREVAAHGPPQLSVEAQAHAEKADAELADLLSAYWLTQSDRQFFAKAIVQPYAQWLAETDGVGVGRTFSRNENRCPRCGGAPQLSVLASEGSATGDGGSRSLICATCLTSWPFRRVVCPACGEGNERSLGYFQSAAFEHVRVDACDSCRRYLKNIDLGKCGVAVPLVDEVAGASLDVWAREHGYEKIELNLLGL